MDATQVVTAFIDAYNKGDLAKVGPLLSAGVRLEHYGTGIAATGRDEVLGLFARSLAGPFADRRFLPARARLADGERVALEHVWQATAAAEVPGRARAGEVVRQELCTIFTVRDGVIVAYDEYG